MKEKEFRFTHWCFPILVHARQTNLERTTYKFDRVDLSVKIYNSRKDRARTLKVEIDTSEQCWALGKVI